MFSQIDKTKFSESDVTISWDEYISLCRLISDKLPPVVLENKICPELNSNLEGLIIIGASILKGFTPVLAPNSKETEDCFKPENFDIKVLKEELSKGEKIPADSFFRKKQCNLYFSTSGSTGVSKHIEKNWSHLLKEAVFLRDLYSINEKDKILSLVSPFHIYGFLHSFLLSVVSGAYVTFVNNKGLLNFDYEHENIKLLITVPAMWPMVENLLKDKKVETVVSSSSDFGSHRKNELENYPGTKFIELYGSTETGGIGYRDIREDKKYTASKSVKLSKEMNGKTIIRSDYVSYGLFELADDLEILDDKHFRFLGRKDRIFKYAGKRHSLTKIEENLKKILGIKNIICEFVINETNLKGGELIAYLECENFDVKDIKEKYRRMFQEPLPSKFHFMEEFPRSTNGKISLDLIKKSLNR